MPVRVVLSIAVVSRFFGGIKLGTGGLARAYGGTAMEAIADAGIEAIVETVRLECRVSFESTGDLHQLTERHGAAKLEEHWDGNGPRLTIEIEREKVDGFVDELAGITAGEGVVERLG